jgi:hypothetical protein
MTALLHAWTERAGVAGDRGRTRQPDLRRHHASGQVARTAFFLIGRNEPCEDSPHFQMAPKVSAKTGSSASIVVNRSINGSNRTSGIVGIKFVEHAALPE